MSSFSERLNQVYGELRVNLIWFHLVFSLPFSLEAAPPSPCYSLIICIRFEALELNFDSIYS